MAEVSGDSTEQPTPKRLQTARMKGRLADGNNLNCTAVQVAGW